MTEANPEEEEPSPQEITERIEKTQHKWNYRQ
jgi:hypothetical protein